MLNHVYQKSISELLQWVLVRIDQMIDSETMERIGSSQQHAISKLINNLGPEYSEEHNLNACSLLQEFLKIKEFNDQIC